MNSKINNMQDAIYSRDVIARIEELESELDSLRKLADEASDCADDWEYGEALIRDTYFKEYAQGLAKDCGMVPDDSAQWPARCIDWDQAARELKVDYAAVDFDGVTYWIR